MSNLSLRKLEGVKEENISKWIEDNQSQSHYTQRTPGIIIERNPHSHISLCLHLRATDMEKGRTQ